MRSGVAARVGQCLLLLVGLTLGWISVADDKGPLIPKGKGESCVAETNYMRRNHMDLIVHQRDETVIKGIRDEPFSLVECVDCHAQKDANDKYTRVDAEGQFCASCHTYVAANIDCFGCHAAVPDAELKEDVGSNHWIPNKHLLAYTLKTANAMKPVEGAEQNEISIDKPD